MAELIGLLNCGVDSSGCDRIFGVDGDGNEFEWKDFNSASLFRCKCWSDFSLADIVDADDVPLFDAEEFVDVDDVPLFDAEEMSAFEVSLIFLAFLASPWSLLILVNANLEIV